MARPGALGVGRGARTAGGWIRRWFRVVPVALAAGGGWTWPALAEPSDPSAGSVSAPAVLAAPERGEPGTSASFAVQVRGRGGAEVLAQGAGAVRLASGFGAGVLVLGAWRPGGRDGDWAVLPARLFAAWQGPRVAVVLGSFALRSAGGVVWAGPATLGDSVAGDVRVASSLRSFAAWTSRGLFGAAVRGDVGDGPRVTLRAWAGTRALASGAAGGLELPAWSGAAVARDHAVGADLVVRSPGLRAGIGGYGGWTSGDVAALPWDERRVRPGGRGAWGLVGTFARATPGAVEALGALMLRCEPGGASPGGIAQVAWSPVPWAAVGGFALAWAPGFVSPYGWIPDPLASGADSVGGRAGVGVLARLGAAGKGRARLSLGAVRDRGTWKAAGRLEGRVRAARGLWVLGKAWLAERVGEGEDAGRPLGAGTWAGLEGGRRGVAWGRARVGWSRSPGAGTWVADVTGDLRLASFLDLRVQADVVAGPWPGRPSGGSWDVRAGLAFRSSTGVRVEAGAAAAGSGLSDPSVSPAGWLRIGWSADRQDRLDGARAGEGGEGDAGGGDGVLDEPVAAARQAGGDHGSDED